MKSKLPLPPRLYTNIFISTARRINDFSEAFTDHLHMHKVLLAEIRGRAHPSHVGGMVTALPAHLRPK